MRRRQPLPSLWLMTDERMGDELWPALARLPRGSGVVFRHHETAADARRRLFDEVRQVARARRLILLLAGPPALAMAWKADGVHGRSPHRRLTRRLSRSVPVHSRRERLIATRLDADLLFVSPVFATRSHVGSCVLGRTGFARLAIGAEGMVIALGGMTAARARTLAHADGWAAIDAWLGRSPA